MILFCMRTHTYSECDPVVCRRDRSNVSEHDVTTCMFQKMWAGTVGREVSREAPDGAASPSGPRWRVGRDSPSAARHWSAY